jgi:DNA end-binding protein Ku
MAKTKRSTKRATSNAEGADGAEGSSRRALWKGSIAFGLIQIPVGLHAAEKPNELAFHQLDKRDMSPIGYERINKSTGKKVEWGDIVKGYELSKGRFVPVTDDDFKKANVQASQTIDIQDFVDAGAIPPSFYERPYYLVPEKGGAKAYSVLHDAMVHKSLTAIALVVIRTRQHLAAILPSDGRLNLQLLRFAHELRSPSEAGASLARGPRATAREVALAEQLIEGMVSPWDPSRYKDTYQDDLLAAIRQKAKTGVVEPKHTEKATEGGTLTDLVSLLEKSLARKKKGSGARAA